MIRKILNVVGGVFLLVIFAVAIWWRGTPRGEWLSSGDPDQGETPSASAASPVDGGVDPQGADAGSGSASDAR